MAQNSVDFEASLASLEDIVSRLESGECSLDESIKLFESGMKNIENCRKALKKAEKKIIMLTELESGNDTDA